MALLRFSPVISLFGLGLFFLLLPVGWRTRLGNRGYPWQDLPYSLRTTLRLYRGTILMGILLFGYLRGPLSVDGIARGHRWLNFWSVMAGGVPLMIYSNLLARLSKGPSEMNLDEQTLKVYWIWARAIGTLLLVCACAAFLAIRMN